jgi:hypothetical protein
VNVHRKAKIATETDSDRSVPGTASEVAARLEALRREATSEFAAKQKAEAERLEPASKKQPPKRRAPGATAILVTRVVVLALLPFAILVGGSVWLYRAQAMPTWLALGSAAIFTALILTWYGGRVAKTLTGRHRFRLVATRIALPIVALYCGYTLLFLSKVNAKSEDVRTYYTSVHPLLRLALSTAILADRDIVVTDTAREAADYGKMGLPVYENSLHFKQDDGYVHAVDLRTIGRSPWRNWLTIAYFKGMGFRTLRHVGTADHLHVSLPAN